MKNIIIIIVIIIITIIIIMYSALPNKSCLFVSYNADFRWRFF